MPWSTTRPRGTTTAAKYRTKQHRDQVKAYKAQLARDGHLVCAQPVCVHPTRTILPGMRWCAGHDDTGATYIGPVHATCNVKDGARRGRARQGASALRW